MHQEHLRTNVFMADQMYLQWEQNTTVFKGAGLFVLFFLKNLVSLAII